MSELKRVQQVVAVKLDQLGNTGSQFFVMLEIRRADALRVVFGWPKQWPWHKAACGGIFFRFSMAARQQRWP